MPSSNPKKALVVIEEITDVQEIAEVQLYRLKELSRDRALTYEEVKIFDILTKNLLLAKGQDSSIPADSKHLGSEADENMELLKIADVITENHAMEVLNKAQDEQSKEDKS